MIKEIEADAKQHGDERRTLIQAEKKAVAEIKVIDEPVTVVVSLKGWVRALKGHEIDAATLAFKAGDGLYGVFPCRTVDALLVFGSNGRVYSTTVAQLPGGRGDGQPITTLVELETGTQPAALLRGGGGHAFAAGQHRRLRPAGPGGRHDQPAKGRQELPHAGSHRQGAAAGAHCAPRTARWPACR